MLDRLGRLGLGIVHGNQPGVDTIHLGSGGFDQVDVAGGDKVA